MSEELTIDTVFSELGWPLSDEERVNLRENLLKHGCREPILVWANHDNTILDGHNRYRICTDEGITFKVKAIHLETHQDCIDFICDLQLSRRNSTEEHKAFLRGMRYNTEKASHGGDHPKVASSHSANLKTAEKIAKETGVSKDTVIRDGKFTEAVLKLDKPIKDAVIGGELKASRKDVKALSDLPEKEQKEVVDKVKRGEAKNVKAALKSKTESHLDPLGTEIPVHLLKFSKDPWRKDTVKLLNKLVEQTMSHAKPPGGHWFYFDEVREHLNKASRRILNSIFHIVCPQCKGDKDGCDYCTGAGWLPEWRVTEIELQKTRSKKA